MKNLFMMLVLGGLTASSSPAYANHAFTVSEAGKRIELKDVAATQSAWNCGPISAYRLRSFYEAGAPTQTYCEFEGTCPKALDYTVLQLTQEMQSGLKGIPAMVFGMALMMAGPMITTAPPILVGPGPKLLAQYMSSAAQTYVSQTTSDLEDLVTQVAQDKPILVLLNLGDSPYPIWNILAGTLKNNPDMLNNLNAAQIRKLKFTPQTIPDSLSIPQLHYVVVNGYDFNDEGERQILYVDTNNAQVSISEAAFLRMWNFKLGNDFVGQVLKADSVAGGTSIYAQ